MGKSSRPESVTYPVNLDIGEVAHGHHLIVHGITLRGTSLILKWAFDPEVPGGTSLDVYPNMSYGADVSPRGWGNGVADFDQFERPVPRARYLWFDFFPPDYDWHGQPDSDCLRNRIARLTFNLKTRKATLEK
jgi:hypothetical protein